ncbi:MAG: cohesin domain-containing protein [Candidatus Vogelbacteria bacterium]
MVRQIYYTKIISVVTAAFFLGLAAPVLGATLSLTPATGAYTVGAPFTATVVVTSSDKVANALSGVVTFPTNRLEVVSLNKNNSVITYWVNEPNYSNATGQIKFEGVVPNPGFSGVGKRVLAITFRPKIVGPVTLTFSEGSVLANDGQGTNILSGLANANYGIVPVKLESPAREATTATTVIGAPGAPQVTSTTHPDPASWYNHSNPVFQWELASEITGVNILADHSPSTNPGTASDGRFSTYSYKKEVKDGAWYFHLRLRNAGGWGDITHFGFNIDTAPPTDLQIIPVERLDATDPIVAFTITASDQGSGLDRYEISMDGEPAIIWSDNENHRFTTPVLKLGEHTLLVKVYDWAGNELAGSVNFSIAPLPAPKILEYPREIATGEIITLRGEALAGGLVTVSFKHPDGSETTRETRSDQVGRFVISVDEKWPAGVYTATAMVKDNRGAESAPSEAVVLTLYLPALWQWGNALLRWLSLIIPILALLILLLFIILWSYYRLRRIKQAVRRESREATEALHKSFDFLREKSRDQLALLEKAKANRVLTKEETAIAENLKQSLNDVESYVRKEIVDIEKIVD